MTEDRDPLEGSEGPVTGAKTFDDGDYTTRDAEADAVIADAEEEDDAEDVDEIVADLIAPEDQDEEDES